MVVVIALTSDYTRMDEPLVLAKQTGECLYKQQNNRFEFVLGLFWLNFLNPLIFMGGGGALY